MYGETSQCGLDDHAAMKDHNGPNEIILHVDIVGDIALNGYVCGIVQSLTRPFRLAVWRDFPM